MTQSSHADYTFFEVETGEAAFTNLKNDRPDCILLDYNLPEVDGLEFLAELSKQYNVHAPAIVMLTGEGNEGIAVRAMKNGAQDYLVKAQISGDGLRRSIKDAIEKTEMKHLAKIARRRIETSGYHR